MAEATLCPRCKRISYTAAPDEPSPCPYCGYLFRKTEQNEEDCEVSRNIVSLKNSPQLRLGAPWQERQGEAIAKEIKGRILVVDNTPLILELLMDRLTEEGYEVDIAVNGLEGLKMLSKRAYDLIISDLQMPIMGGVDFYKNLLETMPSMKRKILFLTASIDDAETEIFIKKNEIQYLFKPFKVSELLRALNTLVAEINFPK